MTDLRADLASFRNDWTTLERLSAALQADRVDFSIADQFDPKFDVGRGGQPVPPDVANALKLFLQNADAQYMNLAETIGVLSLMLQDTAVGITTADQSAAAKVLAAVQFRSPGGGAAPPAYGPGEQNFQDGAEDDFLRRFVIDPAS